MKAQLCIAAALIGSMWFCGCGTMAPRSGANQTNRISGLKGRTIKEGETRSLYSTRGVESDQAASARRAREGRRNRPVKASHDTTLIAVNDPVKKRNLITWDTTPGWFYTLMYKRRGVQGAWDLLPNAINLPGTGRTIKVIDNLPTHMDHAYNVDVSPVKRQATPQRPRRR